MERASERWRAGLVAIVLALTVMAGACEGPRDKGAIDREAATALFEEVPIAAPPGMSDLTIDDRGVLWAIAERDPVVVEIELGKPPITHRLVGITPGIDTEAIVWLGGGRFAIGIEGAMTPAAGIMFAELRGSDVVITSTRPLHNKDLGVSLTINHGIESICGREHELIVAGETVGQLPDGKRWAPIVRLRDDTVTAARLWLTTKRGKISALHCAMGDDGVADVTAIERHFGVARLLRFKLDRDTTDVTPTIEVDLFPVLRDNFNLEGITRLPDGRIVLINDNQGKTADGPTQLFVFHARK